MTISMRTVALMSLYTTIFVSFAETNSPRQTQLRGLRGVNVNLVVVPPDILDATTLKRVLQPDIDAILSQAKIDTESDEGSWLNVIVQGFALSDDGRGCAGNVAVLVSVRLLERASLVRDPNLVLPSDGAITWWSEGIITGEETRLQERIGQAVRNRVTDFAAAVSAERTLTREEGHESSVGTQPRR